MVFILNLEKLLKKRFSGERGSFLNLKSKIDCLKLLWES
jgi:hypothetical protein